MRRCAPILLLGLILAVALALPAEAQSHRGVGRGKGRELRQSGAQPAEAPPGEYALDGPKAHEAIARGEGPAALAYYERVAAEAEQKGDTLRAARAWHPAALVAFRLGRYQKAIQAGIHGIDAFKRTTTAMTQPDLGAWASTYAQLGSAYRAVRDLEKARQTFEEGLEFSRTRLSGRHEGNAEGFLLNGLALVAYAQQDYPAALSRNAEAARFFEEAERRLRSRAPPRARASINRWAANAFLGIGRAQLALGHPDLAGPALDRALRYAGQSNVRSVELEVLGAQAGLALARRDWPNALALYEQQIAASIQINRTGALPGLYNGKTRALEGLGRDEEAGQAAREAVRAIEEIRADLGDSGLRSSFFDDKQGIYQHAVYLALRTQRPDEAFALAERGRSRTFLDLLGTQTPLSKGRTRALVDEEVRLRARLAEAQAQTQDVEGSEEAEQARSVVEAVDRDYRAFLARVRTESLEQASLMVVEPVTLPEIQGLLPPGTTLLEYQVGDGGLFVWVIDRERFTAVSLPGDRESLLGQVRRFRAAITSQASLADVEAQAQALYRRLLAPVREEIRGNRVVIVPHGVLHYLPFVALRSPAGRWVVEDLAVSTLPSASVLRYLVDKGVGAPARTLVVGNPDLGPGLALPWAEREARQVAQHERDAIVLVRGDASEAGVKKVVETAGLVHFATHGELNESDPLSSAVLLVPGGGEDGRLEVREVFGLDLHARLVVLSACETGLGKLSRGDELVGLQRAFLYAGTPAVVTTLWKVDDRATYELVRGFYDKLDTMGPVEGLRQAQRETLRAFRHPFAWAAFGVTGMPR